MMRTLMIVAVVYGGSIATTLAQDLAAGATSYKKCATCHDVGEAAKNKVGPILNGLENRNSGSIPGYSYSEANKNSGIVWNEASFLDYIKNPAAKIPKTKMVFAGIKNETEAKHLWAFLKQYGPDGKKK